MTLLICALALAPAADIPAKTEIVYPNAPVLIADALADGTKPTVWLQQTSATLGLTRNAVTVKTLGLYKNESDKPVNATLTLNFSTRNRTYTFGQKPVVVWSDKPLQAVDAMASSSAALDQYGDTTSSGYMTFKYRVALKAKGTHSLKTEVTLPVGVTGIDREERILAYGLGGLPQSQPLKAFHFAIQHQRGAVFQVIETDPVWGWQVGPQGAFFKKADYKLGEGTLLTFRYYPGGFGDIGQDR